MNANFDDQKLLSTNQPPNDPEPLSDDRWIELCADKTMSSSCCGHIHPSDAIWCCLKHLGMFQKDLVTAGNPGSSKHFGSKQTLKQHKLIEFTSLTSKHMK